MRERKQTSVPNTQMGSLGLGEHHTVNQCLTFTGLAVRNRVWIGWGVRGLDCRKERKSQEPDTWQESVAQGYKWLPQ